MAIFYLEKKLKRTDQKVRLKTLKFITLQKLLELQVDWIDNTKESAIKSIDLFLGSFLLIELTGEILKILKQTKLEDEA